MGRSLSDSLRMWWCLFFVMVPFVFVMVLQTFYLNEFPCFIIFQIVYGKSLELPYGVGIVGKVGNVLGRTQ